MELLILCCKCIARLLPQVIVAHRLSTIMDADQILVLAKGQVVECGSHAALVAAGGLYASMWARQQDSASCAPSPAPKLVPGSGIGKDATDGSNSSNDDRNKADSSSLNGSSRTQPQLTEVQEADVDEGGGVETGGDSIDAESRGSVGGVQSPPPSLPPLPRLQRRLHMQPHMQRAGTGNQQCSGAVSGSGSRPSRQPGAHGEAWGGDTSAEDAAGGGAEDGGERSRSVGKLRCNSSCGHGRHANFWSRVSVQSVVVRASSN